MDCLPVTVTPILFTTMPHCPQKWPKKDGTPYWNCPDPVTHFIMEDETNGGAVCDRHLAFYTDCTP